jgi:hypothetical protein
MRGLRKKSLVVVCLLVVSLLTFVPLPQAKAMPSGQWHKFQIDTHTGYSQSAPPANSLYSALESWHDAGVDIVNVKDYFNRVIQSGYSAFTSSPGFEPAYYNYTLTGSGVAGYSASYPSNGGSAGAGRLYINGTGKASVSYAYDTGYGKYTLDKFKYEYVDQFSTYLISTPTGNVAFSLQFLFTSGKKIVFYDYVGAAPSWATNSSNSKYIHRLIFTQSFTPYEMLAPSRANGVYGTAFQDYASLPEYSNPNFNFTKFYQDIWGVTAMRDDALAQFKWEAESFNASSWLNLYIDVFNWFAQPTWSHYTQDIAEAETDFNMVILPSLEVAMGVGTNQLFACDLDASGISYDGSLAQFLLVPAQVIAKDGFSILEETYYHPNGSAVVGSAVDLTDWFSKGFIGFVGAPFDLPLWWDKALTQIYNSGNQSEKMYNFQGAADLHGNYTLLIPRSSYGLVWIDGTVTHAKVREALLAGHVQNIFKAGYAETTWSNIAITDFSIGNYMMGDWASPSNSQLSIAVSSDNNIQNTTLWWNGKILKSWIPNAKTFSTTVNVAMGGVLRLTAQDQTGAWTAIGNPIFLTPSTPYVTETTYPKDLSALYSSDKFTLTVTAPSGSTSTTKVYCGDLQKPKSVNGLSSTGTWNYDDSTKILTIVDTHSSSLTFTVSWSGSASGKYTLTVQVLSNYLPTSAIVQIQNVNQTTDLLGRTSWLLPYGSYDLRAFYGEQKQSMTVLLNEDKTVGFNFIVLPKPPNFTPLIAVLVVIVAALMLFFLFQRKR